MDPKLPPPDPNDGLSGPFGLEPGALFVFDTR
jgi:hypothetical protein